MCKKVLKKHEMNINEILDLMVGPYPIGSSVSEFLTYCNKRDAVTPAAIDMHVEAICMSEEDCFNLCGDFELCEVIETENKYVPVEYTKDRAKARYNAHAKRKERAQKLERKAYKPRQPKVYKRTRIEIEW